MDAKIILDTGKELVTLVRFSCPDDEVKLKSLVDKLDDGLRLMADLVYCETCRKYLPSDCISSPTEDFYMCSDCIKRK